MSSNINTFKEQLQQIQIIRKYGSVNFQNKKKLPG